MKLPQTDKFLEEGIGMKKLNNMSFFGNAYDHKTVFDLEEAVRLNAYEGWNFVDGNTFFSNLGLYLYRDLKKIEEKKK